jgi:hypothetical protein
MDKYIFNLLSNAFKFTPAKGKDFYCDKWGQIEEPG